MQNDAKLTVTILGSGGSTGVPMPACQCQVCSSSLAENQRTRCSALFSYRGCNVLIDAATDLRQQVLREKISRIDALLLTHTHADHVHGIDDLRPFNRPGEDPIPVYGSAATVTHLQRVFPYIFTEDPGDGYRPRLVARAIEAPFQIGELPLTPVPLLHGHSESLGFRCGNFAYLTDCSAIPDSSMELLHGVELLVLDGLRFRPHATHFNIDQAIETARRIGASQTYLTHLTHDVDHRRHQADLPAGFGFAFDGQRLDIPLP